MSLSISNYLPFCKSVKNTIYRMHGNRDLYRAAGLTILYKTSKKHEALKKDAFLLSLWYNSCQKNYFRFYMSSITNHLPSYSKIKETGYKMHENRSLYKALAYTITGLALGVLSIYAIPRTLPLANSIIKTSYAALGKTGPVVHVYKHGHLVESHLYGHGFRALEPIYALCTALVFFPLVGAFYCFKEVVELTKKNSRQEA